MPVGHSPKRASSGCEHPTPAAGSTAAHRQAMAPATAPLHATMHNALETVKDPVKSSHKCSNRQRNERPSSASIPFFWCAAPKPFSYTDRAASQQQLSSTCRSQASAVAAPMASLVVAPRADHSWQPSELRYKTTPFSRYNGPAEMLPMPKYGPLHGLYDT